MTGGAGVLREAAMKITSRVRKLEARRPTCAGGTTRIVGPGDPLTEADRCRACGGCHVLVVEEVVVRSAGEARRWHDENRKTPEA